MTCVFTQVMPGSVPGPGSNYSAAQARGCLAYLPHWCHAGDCARQSQVQQGQSQVQQVV